MEIQKNPEKSISEQFPEEWAALSRNQQRYVIAMLDNPPTKAEAAESIGIKPDTVYHWNGLVHDLVEMIHDDIAGAAYAIIKNKAPMAAMVKVTGLESESEKTRQDAASEILDRSLGKPTNRTELTGDGGGPLVITRVIEKRGNGSNQDD